MKRVYESPDLSQCAVFARLDSPVLAALQEIARIYTLENRELLFREQDTAHSFYILVRGGIRLLENTPDGQCVTIKVYGPGDCFGLLAVAGGYPHPSSAEAIAESVVISIMGHAAREVMLTYPQFALQVLDVLVSHVHHAHGRVRQMMAERVEQRLARALLHYGSKFGQAAGSVIVIEMALTQQDMAQFAGTSVETVNRTLKTWQERGWIRAARQRIDITDADALNRLAEQDETLTMAG